MAKRQRPSDKTASAVLRHWREAVPDDRLAHLVKDCWRGLTRAFQTRLAEHSVLFGHWVFLRILWERDGLTQSELSEEAGLMLPTTFSALATMERLGYVRRVRRPGDRKKVYFHLTETGWSLRETLVPLAEEVNAIAVKNVPEADLAATRRTFLTMIQNLVADEIALAQGNRRMPSTRDLAKVNAEGQQGGPEPTPRTASGRTRRTPTLGEATRAERRSPSVKRKIARQTTTLA